MAWNNYRIPKRSKYKNQKIVVDHMAFDSKKEANRYFELRLMEKASKIADLQRQVKYVLIPAQREADHVGVRGGIIKGKLIEREFEYTRGGYYCECKKCGYCLTDIYTSEESAIEAWNGRFELKKK